MKIGVFDSGIGGITVLTELRARFPFEEYVYFGDTAHVPYGTKSPAQIRMLSADCCRVLKSKNIELLIVACNTASSLALPYIKEVMGAVPVFGMVAPGVEAVMDKISTKPPKTSILILATRATVRSGAYAKALLARLGENAGEIQEQECPLLVPMIEEGWTDHPILHQTIEEYVRPYKGLKGVALLGCTHYPWIHAAFERALPGWVVINSAQAVTRLLASEKISDTFESLSGKKLEASKPIEWIFTDPDVVPAFVRTI